MATTIERRRDGGDVVQQVVADQRRGAVRGRARRADAGRCTAPLEEPPEHAGSDDDRRERRREHGEGDEGRDGKPDERGTDEGAPPDPGHRLDDDGDHRGCDTGEHRGHEARLAVGDVDGRQHQQGEHPGQHEQPAGDQPAAGAVEQPAGVDRELLGLRTGQQHAVVEGVQETLLTDPALLVDQLVLHDRDLPGRAPEGLQGDREPGPGRLPEGDDVVARLHADTVGDRPAPGLHRPPTGYGHGQDRHEEPPWRRTPRC